MKDSVLNKVLPAMFAGDIDALEEFTSYVDGFPNGADEDIGKLWFHHALQTGNIETITWMLGHDVDLRQKQIGYTALQTCLERDRSDRYVILSLLIAHGADLNQRGINDWTALHQAAVRDDFEAMQILLDAGADPGIRTRIDGYATAEQEARMLGRNKSADFIRDYRPKS